MSLRPSITFTGRVVFHLSELARCDVISLLGLRTIRNRRNENIFRDSAPIILPTGRHSLAEGDLSARQLFCVGTTMIVEVDAHFDIVSYLCTHCHDAVSELLHVHM